MCLKNDHRYRLKLMAIITVVAAICLPVSAFGEGAPSGKGVTKNLHQRIDFGNAYIMGQSIKSGAVYLMHRKQSDISSMIDVRVDYRKEIMEDYDLEDTEMVSAVENQDQKKTDDAIR
jgi:hypothetical protein